MFSFKFKNNFMILMRWKLFIPFILIIVSSIYSCREDNPVEISVPEYSYSVPLNIQDGWETASSEEVGLNPERLTDMINDLSERQNHNLHGILIAKDGKLVFEEYFKGYKYDPENIQSLGEVL